MKNHVWVIEMKDEKKWMPTVGCGLTKDDAIWVKKSKWDYQGPRGTFRIRKYVPEEKG